MINGITNFLTSSTLSNIAQSTTASVSIETGMKAVGRPSFILADKKLDNNTKKYAATKEFLYQATCLATYMAIIIPIFKKGAFKLAKNKSNIKNILNKEYMLIHYDAITISATEGSFQELLNKVKEFIDKEENKNAQRSGNS